MNKLQENVSTLLNSNTNEDHIKEVYYYFTTITSRELSSEVFNDLINKINQLCSRNVLNYNLILISLIANKDRAVLNKFVTHEVDSSFNLTSSTSLFNICHYKKLHWFENVINTNNVSVFDLTIKDVIKVLQLIKHTNADNIKLEVIEKILLELKADQRDDLLNFYIHEVKYALNIIEFLKKHSHSKLSDTEIFNYLIDNCLLNVFAEIILLSDESKWEQIREKLKDDESKQNLIQYNLESENNLTELNIFISFSIIFTVIKIIRSHSYDFNVNLKVNEIVEEISKLDKELQIEIMENIFTLFFLQTQHLESCNDSTFICQGNDVRFILHILKSCFDLLYSKQNYKTQNKSGNDFTIRFKTLNKYVTEALWRFEMITELYGRKKQNIIKYMLVKPEILLFMCLKKGRLDKSHEVIQIFNLHDNPITKEVVITEKLQEFYQSLTQVFKIKEYKRDLPQLPINISNKSPTKVAKEFFESFEIKDMPEENIFEILFDLALTYQGSNENLQQILSLCETYYKEGNSFYTRIMEVFNEIAGSLNLSISDILNNPKYVLNIEKSKKSGEYLSTLEEKLNLFFRQLSHEGNKKSINQTFMKINELASPQNNGVKYLIRLFNYLRIFTKIFYIDQNNTNLLPDGEFNSYFDVLNCSYIDVFGKLIYEKNIDPQDIESSLGKLKIDILYYTIYFSFPLVRIGNKCDDLSYVLQTPTRQAFYYVQKRHWMLAYLLTEMYYLNDLQLNLNEERTKYFKNYTNLQEVQNLRLLYDDNIIITSLNKNYLEKFLNYLDEKIFDDKLESQGDSFEAAEEIFESDYKCNWNQLLNVAESIPQCLIKENEKFYKRKDQILLNLAIDCYDSENFKYVQFIKNPELRLNVIMDNFKKWPSKFCITVLNNEISKDEISESLRNILENWLLKLKFCDNVMKTFEMRDWSEVNNFCNSQKSQVIRLLLKYAKLNYLLEYLEIYSAYEEFDSCITYNDVKLMFDQYQSSLEIKEIFNKLPKEKITSISFDLLKTEKNVKNLKFITNYLFDNLNQQNEELKLIQIALYILDNFNSNEQEQFLPLISSPLDIIETLIMNTKLDKLGQILANINPVLSYYDCNVISEDSLDKLLRKYAEKSLEFRVVLEPHPKFAKSVEYKLLESLDSQYGPEKREFIMPESVPDRTEWVPNNEIIECMCCQITIFSMFNRRHHCRRCGRVVCFNCSTRRMIVPTYGKILVRVCIDCYDQTHFDENSSFNDTLSSKSIMYDFWILTGDLKNNEIIRQEFSYEHAPSVSLCLSIMKYHSKNLQYTRFLLDQCDKMLELLKPTLPNCPQEIDYPLVIKMLRSLAIAAKMFSTECNLPLETSEADRILSQIDLLSLLIEKGCLNLIPLPAKSGAPCVNKTILRKLRDTLLETEQWNFALEVSTKAGLDSSGVFAVWGKSCLKAGCLEFAREKFQRCLDKTGYYEYIDYSQSTDLDESYEAFQRKRYTSKISVSSDSKPHKNPQLLNQIVQILEKQNMKADYISIKRNRNTDTALFIKSKLKSLKSIAAGNYADSNENKNGLNPLVKNECVYYLDKYGNHLSLLRFYLRHNCIREGLMYIIDKQVPTEVFVEIYMICLKDGTIGLLQEEMIMIDSTLDLWKDYLMYICRHLEKQSLLNSLYQLQQFMGDFVRAAMTCIRFFKSNASCYGELLTNLHFLEDAENHFNQELEQQQWVDVNPAALENPDAFEEKSLTNPSLVMRLKPSHIAKNISVIKHQREVTKFIAGNEINDKYVSTVLPFLTSSSTEEPVKTELPTLFDSQDEKVKLAAFIIICNVENGFPVSLRIIREYQLKAPKVFSQVARYLALQGRIIDIKQLINCIHNIDENDKSIIDLCDEVLVLAVRTLSTKATPTVELDLLIRLIIDKTIKVSMYIETKQLKSAYILAAKQKRSGDVRRILREAEMLNKPDIKRLCQKFLQTQPH